MLALVIDDSRPVRLLVGTYLRDMGMEVIEAADGREGLEMLQCHPDTGFALVDWNMPQMDGIEFIRAVRAQTQWSGLRLIMVTTETESAQVARALDAGADEYVMKPFTKEILTAKLALLDLFEE